MYRCTPTSNNAHIWLLRALLRAWRALRRNIKGFQSILIGTNIDGSVYSWTCNPNLNRQACVVPMLWHQNWTHHFGINNTGHSSAYNTKNHIHQFRQLRRPLPQKPAATAKPRKIIITNTVTPRFLKTRSSLPIWKSSPSTLLASELRGSQIICAPWATWGKHGGVAQGGIAGGLCRGRRRGL